jgi:ankyrin repeat protein
MPANDEALIQLDNAARKGQIDIVKGLIAKLENSDDGKKTLSEALVVAVQIGNNLPVVQAFIEKLENSDDGKEALSQALVVAVQTDNNSLVVEALIAVEGIDFHSRNTALMQVVRSCKLDYVQKFIAKLKNSDDGKKALSQALLEAVECDNLPVVDALIENLTNSAQYIQYLSQALLAVRKDQTKIVKALIEKLKNSAEGKKALSQALIKAVECDNLPVVDALIANLENSGDGKKALSQTLITAVMLDNLPVVKALIAVNGIDLNARDEFERTALYWAKNNEEITSLLKTKAKRINQENPDSSSAPSEGSTDEVGGTKPTDTRPPYHNRV